MPHDPGPELEATKPVGGEGRAPLVMLHGFTQTGRCLGPAAELLALDRPVVLPDLPGHGAAASLGGHTVAEGAGYVVREVIEEPRGGDDVRRPAVTPHLFGYSMGARIALRAALDHPGCARSLLLLGGTPGLSDPLERLARARLDNERADAVESLGVARFCEQWLDAPMFSRLPAWARFTLERHSNTPGGLAGSLRNAGTGSMEPLWERIGSLELDVLLIAGALDTRFVAIAAEMADAIGSNAVVVTIPEAGHAAHLEQPTATAAVISEFLDAVEAR